MFHKIRIETDPDNTLIKHVYMDGNEVEFVTAAEVRVAVDEVPHVTLDILADRIEVDMEAEVTENVTYKDAYLKMPMECLGLSVRAYNAVRRGSIRQNGKYTYDTNRTVGDVLQAYKSGRLAQYRMLGDKTFREIEEKLKAKGIAGGEKD